jgi:hypothetical protein
VTYPRSKKKCAKAENDHFENLFLCFCVPFWQELDFVPNRYVITNLKKPGRNCKKKNCTLFLFSRFVNAYLFGTQTSLCSQGTQRTFFYFLVLCTTYLIGTEGQLMMSPERSKQGLVATEPEPKAEAEAAANPCLDRGGRSAGQRRIAERSLSPGG